MLKLIFTNILLLHICWTTNAQQLMQTVRGTVTDSDSKSPIIGATLVVVGTDPLIGTTTDAEGRFRFQKIPTGRITLQLTHLGYESKTIPNIVVNSGKEVILDFSMQESTIKMEEIVVSAGKTKGKPENEMAIVSARSISPEETNRYAGGFNDPSRIVSNFAGVNSSQGGGNDIIVRGNSPKYVQWRLEGVQITNPNHFADQASVGGSISTLNNNLMGPSDFYTGAFTAEYGDVLAGVYDVQFRKGNNEKFESVVGVGIIGTDLTVEGPFKKGYEGSYLLNYRYSTASLISDLGLLDINGTPNFQDAAYKVMLPTKKAGTFSLFGLGGYSSFLLKEVTPQDWETPGDRGLKGNISEDLKKSSYLVNTGIGHTINLNTESFIRSTVSYSSEGIDDKVFESKIAKKYNDQGEFLNDSVISRMVNYKSRLMKSTYRAALSYSNKINARNTIQVGVNYSLFNYNYDQSQILDDAKGRSTLMDFNEYVGTLRNFVTWKTRLNEALTIVSGIHNMNVLFNNKSTVEPRVAVNWAIDNTNTVNIGYGKHSTMESIHNYFTKVQLEDGREIEPNKDLGLLKAHHLVLGYQKRITRNLTAKAEVYGQYLYDLPVENRQTSNYATINEGLDFKYVPLVNKGKGYNYGLELTVERFFSDNYYFLVNTSIYNSKYKALDGVWRNTLYNGNYLFNLLGGKEFVKLGKKQNQTFGINAKVFYGGGRRYIPLLRNQQGNVDVDQENNNFFDYDKAYDKKLQDLYTIILSVSYKWNKPRATHEIFMNLDNLTNTKGKLSEYYDENEPNNVGHTTQFGLFPNLMYRVYF